MFLFVLFYSLEILYIDKYFRWNNQILAFVRTIKLYVLSFPIISF